MHITEERKLFSRFQADFCKNRSCEDNILRIVQKNKYHRSVIYLLDFSKAYDTVWREELLTHMI